MAIASVAVRTSNITIAQSPFEIRTAAAAKARVLEVSLVAVTAVAAQYALGRPAAVGVTPGTTSLFQRDDTADPACVTSINLTWATSPTAPTIAHRRWGSAATAGVGIIWTFPRGLTIPLSSSLSLSNVVAASTLDVSVAIDE